MSSNQLEDKTFYEDGRTFGFLPNLTVLEMDDNKFTQLPVDALVQHKALKSLNVANNLLEKFNPEFTEQIKLGLNVEYAGKCIQPLKLFTDAMMMMMDI